MSTRTVQCDLWAWSWPGPWGTPGCQLAETLPLPVTVLWQGTP